ncbi:MAG: response regulator transcription factor [Beijerinckiaceae bacterium]
MKHVILPSDERSKLLTNREFDIVRLVARGFSNRKIAHELKVKEGTVKVHLNRIFQKLRLKRRHELIVQMNRSDSATHEQTFAP